MLNNLCYRSFLEIYFSSARIRRGLHRGSFTGTLFSALSLKIFWFFHVRINQVHHRVIIFFLLFGLVRAGSYWGNYSLHSWKRCICVSRELITTYLSDNMSHITIDWTVSLHLHLLKLRIIGDDVNHTKNGSNRLALNLHLFVNFINKLICLPDFLSHGDNVVLPVIVARQAIQVRLIII